MNRGLAGCALLIGLAAASAPARAQQTTSIQPGARVRGALGPGDATLSSGEFNDVYTIAGRAGQRLVIRLSSTAFDAYLFIRGPSDFSQDNDDGAQGSNDAMLDVRLPVDGTYRIAATSYRSGEQGDYTLEVQEPQAGQVVSGGAPSPAGGGTIALGQSQRGTLATGDEALRSGELTDTWRFQGRRGQVMTIRLASSEFDPYLLVRGPGDFSADNDDDTSERGSKNARVDATLPADGEYRIVATSYRPGETGGYTLSVQAGHGAVAQQASRTTAAATGAIAVGQTASGRLEAGDPQLRSGEFVDRYAFQGTRGQRLEIRLVSTEFDPYVQINGPGSFSQYNDDDVDGGGSNSRLVVTLPADGAYAIAATSYRPGESGSYQLSVGATGAVSAGSGAAVAANRLTVGQALNGALAGGDDTLQDGELVDRYSFAGQAGQRLSIDMSSRAFDSYVQLVSPTGRQEENDDAAAGTSDARLESILTESGTYTILATSLERGMSGAYRLSLSTIGAGQRAVAAATPTTPAPTGPASAIAIGAPQTGRLQQGDQTLSSGEFVDRYRFAGRRGQVVTVEMTSTELDPYLLIQAPGGAQQENDDAATTDRNARVTWALPADGSYTILATTYRPGESGGYTVRMNAGAAVPTPAEATQRVAAAAGTQRVWALLVGISDYGGRASNLAYTAEDARKMSETLQRAGVLAAGSVTLTDGEATYDRVRTAFADIARQAGPDDVFLFFYSGHGTQSSEDAANTSEPDRRDEAIVLRDRNVSDNEMAQWFGAVRSRMAIIALDACFSGGFARDVISRPGVMGFFSSEEDLTSAVAAKFQAGGYLSHFLRAGLSGEADGDHSGSVTAGELSTYVHRQFRTQASDVEAVTVDRQRNYQFPVIERGGVKIDDIVLLVAR